MYFVNRSDGKENRLLTQGAVKLYFADMVCMFI